MLPNTLWNLENEVQLKLFYEIIDNVIIQLMLSHYKRPGLFVKLVIQKYIYCNSNVSKRYCQLYFKNCVKFDSCDQFHFKNVNYQLLLLNIWKKLSLSQSQFQYAACITFKKKEDLD